MAEHRAITRYGPEGSDGGLRAMADGPYVRYAEHQAELDSTQRALTALQDERDRIRIALGKTLFHVACCHFKADHWCSYRALCYLVDDHERHYLGMMEAIKDATGWDPMDEIPEDNRPAVARAAATYLWEQILPGPSPWDGVPGIFGKEPSDTDE